MLVGHKAANKQRVCVLCFIVGYVYEGMHIIMCNCISVCESVQEGV